MYQSDYRMIIIRKNTITVADYLKIRSQVGWIQLGKEQAQKALENSLYIVGAYDNDNLVGMGRIVGDGAVICYVQDLIVVPESQRFRNRFYGIKRPHSLC